MRGELIEEIEELELVKDVNVDASHVRGLLTEDGGRVGAFVDGKKRPGKIFTSMSFKEGGGERYTAISNASNRWGRHLSMEVISFQWPIILFLLIYLPLDHQV